MPRDLDLRKVRYFLALTRELNYARAAQDLHIAQPVLSRQIQALERELGAQLFLRDRRGVALTAAGEALRIEAGTLLAAAEAARRRVGVAARGVDTLTIAFMPGLLLTEAAARFEALHPGVRVEVLRTGWDDQVEVLRDGRADLSYLRLPVDERGLGIVEVGREPRLAVLAANHRLAGKDQVGVLDLAHEHLLQDPDAVPEWRDVSSEVRDQVPRTAAENAYSVEEKLENVARGRGIAVLPASIVSSYIRPDLATVPVTDIGPSRIALAWVEPARGPLIGDFIGVATRLGSPAAGSAP